MEQLLKEYGSDKQHRLQAIFSSIFILQNRLQTASEKIQTQISMKQWLLLAMIGSSSEEATLTNMGKLMGCSRQNVKKLAAALEKKGFVELIVGNNNSVHIKPTTKIETCLRQIEHRHAKVLQLLFQNFDNEEILQLFNLYLKLYSGVERVEAYAKALHNL